MMVELGCGKNWSLDNFVRLGLVMFWQNMLFFCEISMMDVQLCSLVDKICLILIFSGESFTLLNPNKESFFSIWGEFVTEKVVFAKTGLFSYLRF